MNNGKYKYLKCSEMKQSELMKFGPESKHYRAALVRHFCPLQNKKTSYDSFLLEFYKFQEEECISITKMDEEMNIKHAFVNLTKTQ